MYLLHNILPPAEHSSLTASLLTGVFFCQQWEEAHVPTRAEGALQGSQRSLQQTWRKTQKQNLRKVSDKTVRGLLSTTYQNKRL